MSTAHEQLIERYARGGAALRAPLQGVTPQEATARPGPGKWSIHELVIHLADSDAIAIDRMKRVIAEDNPTLLSADEQAYVDRLHCHEQSLEDAVTLFDLNRRQFVRVLRRLDDAAFARVGTHNVAGALSLAKLIEVYADHVDHHLRFVPAKLERLRA